jgi:hypothetical protein
MQMSPLQRNDYVRYTGEVVSENLRPGLRAKRSFIMAAGVPASDELTRVLKHALQQHQQGTDTGALISSVAMHFKRTYASSAEAYMQA